MKSRIATIVKLPVCSTSELHFMTTTGRNRTSNSTLETVAIGPPNLSAKAGQLRATTSPRTNGRMTEMPTTRAVTANGTSRS
jgi:hypothetical protein